MQKQILIVGSLNMDLVVRTPRHPRIGETIIGHAFQTYPGGKGANQAVAAARLGGSVRMVGKVGEDDFGKALVSVAAGNGVDTRWIFRDPGSATGVALITVDDAGQNSIVVASGANMKLTPEQVSLAQAAFEGVSALVLQLECPLPAVERAAQIAVQHDIPVILNPAPARKLSKQFLRSVDYLIPNQSELELLAGTRDIGEAAALLRELGLNHLIVTLGSDGAVIFEDDQSTSIPAYDVDPLDTTAAGDAFVGAFAVAITEGLDTYQAVVWANAAGALAVTRAGAQPSLPNRSELEAFLAREQ